MRTTATGTLFYGLLALVMSQAVSAQQLLFHFPMDGTAEASGWGAREPRIYLFNNGTTPRTVPGKVGDALYFDGNAAIAMPFELDMVTYPQVTITAWIKVDAGSTGERTIFSAGNGNVPRLMMYTARTAFHAARGTDMATTPIAPDEWVFVAGTVDVGASRLQVVQGDLAQTRERINTDSLYPPSKYRNPEDASLPAMSYVFIGSHGFNQWRASRMAIDEVRVYAGVLSTEQIAGLRAGQAIGLADNAAVPAFYDGGLTQQSIDNLAEARTTPPLQPGGVVDMAGSASTGGDEIQLDLPSGAGSDRASNVLSPELAPLEGQPGLEAVEDLQAAALPREEVPMLPAGTMDEEVYSNTKSGPVRTATIVRPGGTAERQVTYEEIDGLAIAEGDMILGPVAELARWTDAIAPESNVTPGVRRQGLNAVTNIDMLWPNGRIPYVISANLTAQKQTNVNNAINAFNSRTAPNLQWVQRSNEPDFVQFVQGNDARACNASIGRQGGQQTINLSTSADGCRQSTFLHEMLHAAGVWHEQSRIDRDAYVQVNTGNIAKGREHNFERNSVEDTLDIGDYNFTSIMHYGVYDFGKDCVPNPEPGRAIDPECAGTCRTNDAGDQICSMRTIRPRDPLNRIERDSSMRSDLAAVFTLYGGQPGPQLGRDWGDGFYATATAAGDVDGDGRDEVIVGRIADGNSRVLVYDFNSAGASVLATAGSAWGAGIGVTDVAVGDVDGDGVMEIGVTRRAGSSNRWYVYRYNNGSLTQIAAGGDDWGSDAYATSIAFGDVDNDGRDEVAVGRRATEFGRYYLFDDALARVPFERLAIGGSPWDATHYTTALAFGDVDGDSRDELGVTRNAASGMRYEIVAYANGNFTQRHAGGQPWGSGNYATAIDFGNTDDDPGEEFIVGRRAGSGSRFYVGDDQSGGFATLNEGGETWGDSYWTVAVLLEDIDANGRAEVIVARNAGEHGRYYLFKDRPRKFEPIRIGGDPFRGRPNFTGVGATDIAVGDTDGDGRGDLAVTYDQKVFNRMRWETISLTPPTN